MSNLCIVYGWILNINNKRGYTTVTAGQGTTDWTEIIRSADRKLKPSNIIGML